MGCCDSKDNYQQRKQSYAHAHTRERGQVQLTMT